jgi:hypothetical protein
MWDRAGHPHTVGVLNVTGSCDWAGNRSTTERVVAGWAGTSVEAMPPLVGAEAGCAASDAEKR